MGRPLAAGVALALLAACSSSSSGPAPLATFQPAALVLGQADFTSAAADRGGAISAAGVHSPVGDAVASAGGLVLPDTANHRLLVYRTFPTASGAPADAVVGQADLGSGAPSHAAGRLHLPRSVGLDGARLLVADTSASRVVLDAAGTAAALGWDAAAPAYRSGCAGDRLGEPSRAIVAGGRLLVADRGNNRVLVWNTVPAVGTPADLVLGQKDFTHCAANDMVGQGRSGGRSAATLSGPIDLWSDGTRLAVVDQGNHRVLLWTRFPTASGAPADLVIGQQDFLTAVAQTGRTGLSWPGAVASDGERLYLADTRSHRVLVYRSFPSANGAAADAVLGQGDFTHGAANDDAQQGASGAPTARTLSLPTGLALASDHLVVTDTGNHRVLLFKGR